MSARFPHKISGFVAFTNSKRQEARKNNFMPEILKEIEATLMMKLLFSFLGPKWKSFMQALMVQYGEVLSVGVPLQLFFPSKRRWHFWKSLRHFAMLPALFGMEAIFN